MQQRNNQVTRRRWYLLLGGAGIACGVIAWQAGWAQEPIGWMYSHPQDSFKPDHLGDVPQQENVLRSLADDRVRQFDELDRPRFAEKTTNRGATVNEERFSVFASTNEDDAKWAAHQFGLAWDEFGRLADAFTDDHRNPDFGIGQMLVVIDDVPMRESDLPLQTVITQNGQTIVYINVADGQPTLEEQLPRLQQGAVQALLHLAELDRKFPTWAQQGLAEYAAEKLQKTNASQLLAERAEAEEGMEPEDDIEQEVSDELHEEEEMPAAEASDDEDESSPALRKQPAFAGMNLAGGEYWRLQRTAQDKLQTPDEEEEPNTTDSLAKVKFLLEGDDGKHAPAFLQALRMLAEEATDPELASRRYLSHTQLLPIPENTIVDELLEELEPELRAWEADPLRGQPLADPTQTVSDANLVALHKNMEVVLKLAQRVTMPDEGETTIQPRVTEFGANGQREVFQGTFQQRAMNVDQLFHELTSENAEPWATLDANGELLLWTDDDRLEELLGLGENRFSSTWRDGHWVLTASLDGEMEVEAWLEENPDDASRPLIKFAATAKPAPATVQQFAQPVPADQLPPALVPLPAPKHPDN